MTRGTFIYSYNRNGRANEAIDYICSHNTPASECNDICSEVGRRMCEWWNNSFTQMQDRIVVRDRLLRENNED